MAVISRNLNHPVWSLYDLLRTARLNVLYYTCILNQLEKLNFFIQILIAAAIPSSTIAIMKIWETNIGKPIWAVVVFLSSLLAFLQPFFRLTHRIKTVDSILSGYLTLEYDLRELKCLIETERKYLLKHKREFEEALKRRKKTAIAERGYAPNNRLSRKFMMQVKKELPAAKFFIPEGDAI